MQLFLTILSGIANSVDPDQTTPSGVYSPTWLVKLHPLFIGWICFPSFWYISNMGTFLIKKNLLPEGVAIMGRWGKYFHIRVVSLEAISIEAIYCPIIPQILFGQTCKSQLCTDLNYTTHMQQSDHVLHSSPLIRHIRKASFLIEFIMVLENLQ